MAQPRDVSTMKPEGPVPFDFEAAKDLAAKLRTSAELVTATQLPRRRELAVTARADWQGAYAELFDTRMTQCGGDAKRLAEALRDAATKVDQLVEEAKQEQRRRDRANEYLREHAAWRERERERNDNVLANIVSFGGAFDDEPEMPDMTGEPSKLPVKDPNIGPRAEA
jgi:uncharacterized protein YukE